MQYKFFSIPAVSNGESPIGEEMNRFLRGHRVLTVQRELTKCGDSCYWCCCVEYIEGAHGPMAQVPSGSGTTREKIDYRNVLDATAFAKFRILRECRKVIATEDAVPAYAVFIDEHLAEMAKMPEVTLATMKSVSGIGEKKTAKYGQRFLALWEQKRTAQEPFNTESTEGRRNTENSQ